MLYIFKCIYGNDMVNIITMISSQKLEFSLVFD